MNGDEPDDVFLVELLTTFYHEGVDHLARTLQCIVEYRSGKNEMLLKGDVRPRSIERILKDEAHAIKGSAANLRLYRLAKVRAQLRAPTSSVR